MQAFTDSTSFVIATIDDTVDEHDAFISISVLDGNGYNPSQVATENTISVNIQDNDLPEVFLTSDQSRITEGGTVQFLIHSAATVLESLAINYRIDNTGDFSIGGVIETVEIASEEDFVVVSLSIPDNDVFQPTGSITMSLIPDLGYRITAGGESARVVVYDNDAPEGVSILATNESEISEGERARFWISAAQVSDTDRELMVSIFETGEFIEQRWDIIPITIKSGRSSALLSIPTVDDEIS